jgi:4,5-dihydroxyphthalate decarboxylase
VADLKLKTVIRPAGNNAALRDRTVTPPSFAFDFEEVPVLSHAFRRMVRELAYDVCEMAFTTYLCARSFGKGFTAIPIFPVRAFHHGTILHNTSTGVIAPKDLEGQRVGVNRGYTVTTGVWARGILQDEYGVDLSRVTWVLSGDEHVEEFVAPANVVLVEDGKDVTEMLTNGEIPAAVGITVDHPDVAPLIADPGGAALEALSARGLYPINHVVVIRDEVLAAHPRVAVEVFDAFTEAKRRYLDRLGAGIDDPTPVDEIYGQVMDITGDPLPYGIAPNRDMIDRLVTHAVDQGIIDRRVATEELFAPSTRRLLG